MLKIGPEIVNGDMGETVKWAIAPLLMAGQSVDLYGVIITARLGFEYDVDGEMVSSKDVHAHVLAKLDARKAPIAPKEETLSECRMRLAATLQYAVDAHAAVFRAMTAGGQEAIDSLGDDGYVHLAVHDVFMSGANKTAREHLDSSTRAHMDAKDARISRLEQEAYDARVRTEADVAAERDRCLAIIGAVDAVSASRVPQWIAAEARRRILGEPEETLASHAAAVDRQAIRYFRLTGKRHNA